MSETLGKIDKPEASQFKKGRKLFFVPLLFLPLDKEAELAELLARYWQEVESQICNLEDKLARAKKVYHELVPPGEDAAKSIEDLHTGSQQVVQSLLGSGAELQAIEDSDILDEFMDWSRCLSIGLQSPAVFNKVYQSYLEAHKKRNEHIAQRIDTTLQDDEIGVLLMREGHQVQFPADIQVFYVAPPSLDAIRRWLRDQENRPHKHGENHTEEAEKKEVEKKDSEKQDNKEGD